MKKASHIAIVWSESVSLIESQLRVELRNPAVPRSVASEQYGVYSRDGSHLGDIVARDGFFTYEELFLKTNLLKK